MATAAQAVPAGVPEERTWLGHPRGLFVLFLTEMWERFSYYGMRSLLVLYMVNHLFIHPDVGRRVLFFDQVRHSLEALFGPLATQALSSQIYGLYTGFVYFAPFFGGLLADRLLGRRKAVIAGAILMAIGHFMMAVESLFFPALMFLILGNGCFKPNISTQVGGLYPPGDPRRDRAFAIFYVGINLGAFFSPLVCGTLGQRVGWHWGFGAAGVGMVIGLLVYLANQKQLVAEPLPTESKPAPVAGLAAYIAGIPILIVGLLWVLSLPKAIPMTLAAVALIAVIYWFTRLPGDERPRVIAICVACFIVAAFWAVYEQQGNTLQLWADQNTHWPSVLGFTIPSTWYQAFNPFMIFGFTPLLAGFWAWQSKRSQEPTSLTARARLRGDDRGGAGCCARRAAQRAVAGGLDRGLHGGRALPVADRALVRDQGVAGAHRVDDDGRVVPRELHRQLHDRLPRHLLGEDSAPVVLPVAHDDRGRGGGGAVRDRPSARQDRRGARPPDGALGRGAARPHPALDRAALAPDTLPKGFSREYLVRRQPKHRVL